MRGEGEKSFRIQRKAPEKITSVMQIVYDNDYVLPKIIDLRLLAKRWVSKPAEDGQAEQWQTSEDFKTFRTSGKFAEEAWLRYQHVVPTTDDWHRSEQGAWRPASPSRNSSRIFANTIRSAATISPLTCRLWGSTGSAISFSSAN